MVWALPKLCQRLFLTGLPFLTGFRGAILGRRNAPFLVHFWLVWGRRAAAFRRFGTLVFGPVFGAFPGLSSIPIALVPRQSPAQPSPDQLSRCVWAPAQPPPNRPAPSPAHPSQPAQLVGEGLAKAVVKAFPYLGSFVFSASPAQASCQPSSFAPAAQPSSPQSSPAQPKPWCGPCQSSAKGFFLPDSEVPFSAAGALRFCSVFGRFGAAVPLRFAILRGRLWGLVFGASPAQASEPSPAQPSPAQPKPWCGPCQSSAKAFSYRIQMSHFD